jgi:hypothetical protein
MDGATHQTPESQDREEEKLHPEHVHRQFL